MLTLAFDTSTSQGGVAVLEGERVLSRIVWSREKSHSELLTPNIETCLRDAGLEARALDRIAVGHGPGSFTGIRVAINVARSLAYALSKPVFAFDTTEILAAGATDTDAHRAHDERHRNLPILAMINAHKNLIYCSRFEWDAPRSQWSRHENDLGAFTVEEITARVRVPHLCLGDAFDEYEPVFSPEFRSRLIRDPIFSDDPLPEALGRLASRRSALGVGPLDWKRLQALYIRASGAEEKLRESRGSGASTQK